MLQDTTNNEFNVIFLDSKTHSELNKKDYCNYFIVDADKIRKRFDYYKELSYHNIKNRIIRMMIKYPKSEGILFINETYNKEDMLFVEKALNKYPVIVDYFVLPSKGISEG